MPNEENEPQKGEHEINYDRMQATAKEYDAIMEKIEEVFASTPDRKEAERIVAEKYAQLLKEAAKRDSEAQEAWLSSIQEPGTTKLY
jgi:hypothetical protein